MVEPFLSLRSLVSLHHHSAVYGNSNKDRRKWNKKTYKNGSGLKVLGTRFRISFFVVVGIIQVRRGNRGSNNGKKIKISKHSFPDDVLFGGSEYRFEILLLESVMCVHDFLRSTLHSAYCGENCHDLYLWKGLVVNVLHLIITRNAIPWPIAMYRSLISCTVHTYVPVYHIFLTVHECNVQVLLLSCSLVCIEYTPLA